VLVDARAVACGRSADCVGGERAGERLGASVGTPMADSIFLTVSSVLTRAIRRSAVLQRGHGMSIWNAIFGECRCGWSLEPRQVVPASHPLFRSSSRGRASARRRSADRSRSRTSPSPGSRKPSRRKSRMVEISSSGSGGGLGWATAPGYPIYRSRPRWPPTAGRPFWRPAISRQTLFGP
jgi:hypothetical protein